MEVEKRRGISVRAVCVSLQWKGTLIRLIDTPGHTDFSSEIERSFWAIDAAIWSITRKYTTGNPVVKEIINQKNEKE